MKWLHLAPRLNRFLKRSLDLGVSMSMLLAFLPLMMAIGLCVRLRMGRPILFGQERPGYKGRLFKILKFRTMHSGVDITGVLLSDAERLTSLGREMRRFSLDELPQLINVFLGDMSLVGPRPLLVQYLDRYTPDQARRHEVKPGITGWAQVNGRNSISWEEKFRLDVWYVDHWTIFLDLQILWMTVCNVVRREGISAESHPTMPEFTGTPAEKLHE